MPKSIHTRGHVQLAKLLRELRQEAGLTQADIGKHVRRPQSWVSKYEAGEQRLDLVELRTLCREFGISLGTLVSRWEERLSR